MPLFRFSFCGANIVHCNVVSLALYTVFVCMQFPSSGHVVCSCSSIGGLCFFYCRVLFIVEFFIVWCYVLSAAAANFYVYVKYFCQWLELLWRSVFYYI